MPFKSFWIHERKKPDNFSQLLFGIIKDALKDISKLGRSIKRLEKEIQILKTKHQEQKENQ